MALVAGVDRPSGGTDPMTDPWQITIFLYRLAEALPRPDPMGVIGSFDLHVSYFPRVHPATRGDVEDMGRDRQVMQVITNVACETRDLRSAWRPGDRIQAFFPDGRLLAPGTYVTAVGDDTLTLSTVPLGTVSGARLFDADVYEIQER
jgi:hypothetical protein